MTFPFLKIKLHPTFLLCLFILFLPFACKKSTDSNPFSAQPLFELLRKEKTGLDFQNLLTQTQEFNVFRYMYFFNGGGVAAADFNQDGLVDLYFTGNMVPNKLFLNEGGLKFRDVTKVAGVAGLKGWTTGVSVADVNQDGLPDIYVGMVGDFENLKGQNQLFICQGIENGIPIFEDKAAEFGLDLVGFSTQAVFFDYDLDGDLDLFQLNHSVHSNGTFGQKASFENTFDPKSGDKLMRNEDGKFRDVTPGSGIKSTKIGYGLGVVAGDINLDGWPDLYIGNDFHENDYLYLNQGDYTFKEVLTEQMMHTSRFSMGVDMADINNDGWSEIISLDMLPKDPFILKSSLGEDDFGVYRFKLIYGYNHQYARNNLQLNNGDGTFSEIGIFAGVEATDWSWAPLFLDFENDGYKDLYISNGIPRRMNDIDYANFRLSDDPGKSKSSQHNFGEDDLAYVEKMPQIKLPNTFFSNQKNLQFRDIEKLVKGNAPSYSNGSVYADFDKDGDLDLVVNNIEDEPFLYKNLSAEQKLNPADFLSFQLKGSEKNTGAIGARVIVFKKDGTRIMAENFPVRGYQSSMLIPLHIGVGDQILVDSVLVIWPDRTFQKLSNPIFNQNQKLTWQAGLPVFDFHSLQKKPDGGFDFQDITDRCGLDFLHQENDFVEFNRESLMPHMVSSEGPALAVGDVNKDGLDDLFFGSATMKKSALYFQTPEGKFLLKTPEAITRDSLFEDVDAVFADIENDGDLDLVVAAGGNEFAEREEATRQRIYLNDGKGNFDKKIFFEGVYCTASCVLPADFNQDGLVDFFIGARAVPGNYGLSPTSILLENKGGGKFEIVTNSKANGLEKGGLVKDAIWADLDEDGDPDLILALEWQPVTVFYNENGSFKKRTLGNQNGWWNFVQVSDLDGDGDQDILAGNFGQNNKLRPSENAPVKMYLNDFDDNGQIEQILTYQVAGKEIPFANYRELTNQLPLLKKKFLYAKDFAKATIQDLFGKEKLNESLALTADCFESGWFEQTGAGFQFHSFPSRLQFSPLKAAAFAKIPALDRAIILAGNFYESNIEMGRYDANFGNLISIKSTEKTEVFPLGNLKIKGQVRRIEPIKIKGKRAFVFARNNDKAIVIQQN